MVSLEAKIDELMVKYQNKFDLLMSDLRNDLSQLVGLDNIAVDEITVGEARRVAILKESAKHEKLVRQNLSEIARQFGKEPGSLGVYFRPDVDLLATRGKNMERFVTEKGKKLVDEFDTHYGSNWVANIADTLADKSIPDYTKIKIRIRKEG